jgi:hypothetical protein
VTSGIRGATSAGPTMSVRMYEYSLILLEYGPNSTESITLRTVPTAPRGINLIARIPRKDQSVKDGSSSIPVFKQLYYHTCGLTGLMYLR